MLVAILISKVVYSQPYKYLYQLVSQFTLCGDISKGNRPSYINAMQPKEAEKLYNKFIKCMKNNYAHVKQGIFKANMNIDFINIPKNR